MSEEEKFPCPNCGTLVSKDDVYCRKCGANLTGFSKTVPEAPPPTPERLPKEVYERKLSLTQRFYKLLTAPSEAMRDIALAPDYEGIIVVLALDFVLLAVTLGLVMQKIRLSGPYAGRVGGMLSGILAVAVFIAVIILAVKWAVKSLIVKHACDSGSGWDFKTAASVTGYAYIADVVMSIVGLCLAWFLLPTFHLDLTDLEALRQAVNDYQAQLDWLRFMYTLPFSFFGLVWKSYLGGLGARFGTKEKCSLSMGILVFFVLSLIGFLISFIT